MVRYFEKGLKPSIKAEMNQDATHLDNYEELVAKVVRAKVKTGLRPSFYVWETDFQVFQGSQPTHSTVNKVQTEGVVSCGDDSKASKDPASNSVQDSEPSNKAKKDKKKKHHWDKKDSRKPKDSTIPASEINAAEVKDKKKRNKKDVSKITYFNCNKKKHYLNKSPEPPKN